MSKDELIAAILMLTPEGQREVIGEVVDQWAEIEPDPDMTPEFRAELERRHQDILDHPENESSWEEVSDSAARSYEAFAMKFQLSIRKGAEDDLTQAIDFYENQQPGLGRRFHDDVAQTLRLMQRHPLMYSPTDIPGYRKAVLTTFPYSIFYCAKGTKIFVVAVHPARSGTAWHIGRV